MLRIIKDFYKRKKFKSKEYWENRYKFGGNSGDGSYGVKAEYKAKILNRIIKKYKIENIIEFGCGDGNNLSLYNISKYIGFDVSETAINICIEKYKLDDNKTFIHYNPALFKAGGLKSELTISFEVIFHLVEDTVFLDYITNLFKTSSKYVLIFSSNSLSMKDPGVHVKHRRFIDYIPKDFILIDLIETPKNGKLKELFSNFYLFEKK